MIPRKHSIILTLATTSITGCISHPALPPDAELVYFGKPPLSNVPITGPARIYVVNSTTNQVEFATATDGRQSLRINGLKEDQKYKFYYEPNELFRRLPEQLEFHEKNK